MKTKKLQSDLLKKVDDFAQTDLLLSKIKQLKKKYTLSKQKPTQPTPTRTQHPSSSSNNHITHKDDLLLSETKQSTNKNSIMSQELQSNKFVLKLPVILPKKGNKKLSKDMDNEHYSPSDEEQYQQLRTSSHSNNKIVTVGDQEQEDKVASFLKFMQIKALKPMEKSNNIQKTNSSLHSIKITRQDKSIPQKLNNIYIHHSTPNHSNKKKSQSKLLPIKNQQKSQKSITSYTINKQKNKHINNFHLVRKKKQFTNTYCDFCQFVCIVNKVSRPKTPTATYKAYIGKGNNSILIKNCLKTRFWWNIVDSDSQINLHWTQSRDQKFLQTLKCYLPSPSIQHPKKITRQFILPKQNKQPDKTLEQIQEYINIGFDKFLTEQEIRQYSKNHYQIQFQNVVLNDEIGNPNKNRIHNHLEFNWHVCNKKALYYNLKKYYTAINEDPFQYIPLTFHIQKHGDTQWQNFVGVYTDRKQDLKRKRQSQQSKPHRKKKEKNIWIVKPGENSNQGNGIQVFENLEEIAEMVKNTGTMPNGKQRSYIIQKYLMPFLYNKRKFDIRCYVLVTSIKGIYKGYWYEEGYIRTSSKEFTMKNLKNRFIHLTNDAVQKKSQDYGKFENGNKISFADFQKYLANTYPDKDYKFYKTIYPAMLVLNALLQKRSTDAIKSTCMLMDSNKREYSFELFGLDFMIDEEFATWLIQVNTNPCLQLGSPLLARIIPNMIENVIKIAIDPLFPPPKQIPKTKNLPTDIFQTNKFTLIFNSSQDHQILTNLTKDTNLQNIMEGDQQNQNHDDIQ